MTDQYFTLVFRGDIRVFKDLLKTETEFGIPAAAGIGDAFEEIEELRDIKEVMEQRIEQLEAALREIVDFPNIGEKAAQQVSLIASAALSVQTAPSTPHE